MSHCVECGQRMDKSEATVFFACHRCRKRLLKKGRPPERVRDLNSPGTEQVGRTRIALRDDIDWEAFGD